MKTKYPKTIDNGVGEKLTFMECVVRNNIEYLKVENEVSPGAGPPMHVHHFQNEQLTVTAGTMGVEIEGEEIVYYGVGQTVLFEKGIMHRFWNAGSDTLRGEGEVWPANNVEYFLTEIFRSAFATKTGMPSKLDAAYLLTRYKSEFDMKAIPNLVKRIVFPALILFGRLTKRYDKFKNAPPPI